jgi:hypothetical protein
MNLTKKDVGQDRMVTANGLFVKVLVNKVISTKSFLKMRPSVDSIPKIRTARLQRLFILFLRLSYAISNDGADTFSFLASFTT